MAFWNAGDPKVKGSIWNTKYNGHNIEVQGTVVLYNFTSIV